MAVLRIVAGERRGHRLRVPPGDVRPTGERVREAVFDVLGSVEGEKVLDLFAGSGALGLEALSRGASRAVFVEADRLTARVLRRNIAALSYEDRSEVLAADHLHALDRLAARGELCDLLFVDPPYRMLAQVLADLGPRLPCILASGGRVVVEGPVGVEFDGGLDVVFRRQYGRTLITIIDGGVRPK